MNNISLNIWPRRFPLHRPKFGFTLIELLVVISIIALLVAILLPALAKARDAARASACASGEKQIGLAMFNYTSDSEGFLPHGARWGYGIDNNFHVTWDDLISRYLGKAYPQWGPTYGYGWAGYRLDSPMDVLTCQSDRLPLNAPYTPETGNYKRSYAVPVADLNGTGGGHSDTLFCVFNGVNVGANFRYYRPEDAPKASETLLLVERHSNQNIQGTNQNVYCQYTVQQFSTTSNVPLTENGAHGGRWNYLFADGHVSLLLDRDTWGTAGNNPAYAGLWWSLGPWTRNPND